MTIPTGLATDRWIRQIRIAPGDRRLLRAAFAGIAPGPGRSPQARRATPVWAAAWSPWQPAIAPPDEGAFFLPAGSAIVVELHYRGLESPSTDRSSVELSYADTREWNRASSFVLDATTRVSPRRRTGERAIPSGATVWAIRPERLADGQALEVSARAPDGSVQILLWIPKYRAEWPVSFVLARPLRFAPGTRLRVTATGASTTPPPGVVLAALW